MKNRTHMIDYHGWQIEAVDEVKTVRTYEARNGKQYVNVEKAISVLRLRSQQLAGMYGDLGGAASGAALLLGKLADEEAEDIIPVVRCKDCVYWKDRHLRLNDGTERPYNSTDDEYVSLSVGYNISAKCHYEDGRGWDSDNSVFRNADDYCSRGVRRKVCRCRRNDACDIKEKKSYAKQ